MAHSVRSLNSMPTVLRYLCETPGPGTETMAAIQQKMWYNQGECGTTRENVCAHRVLQKRGVYIAAFQYIRTCTAGFTACGGTRIQITSSHGMLGGMGGWGWVRDGGWKDGRWGDGRMGDEGKVGMRGLTLILFAVPIVAAMELRLPYLRSQTRTKPGHVR